MNALALAKPTASASGVTLGLAASAGGLTAPLLGWIASSSGLTVTLVAVSVSRPSRRSPRSPCHGNES